MDDDARDWSLLPLDLLRKLGEMLHIPHRIVFRTVCKSWCSALPSIVFPYPWLLLPAEQIDDSCTFLSLPSDNEHCSSFKFSPVPPLHGMRYAGSNTGWVAIVDLAFNISLLNPLTGAQIHLPSFLPIPRIEPLPNCGGYLCHNPHDNSDSYLFEYETCRDYFINKVVFSSNPTPNNYMAMVIRHEYPTAYTKAGISKWISLDIPVLDIIYHDGLFYALRCVSEVYAFDLSGDNPVKKVIIDLFNSDIKLSDSFLSRSYTHQDKYLAFSSTGELFLIMRCNIYVDAPNDTKKFETESFMISKYNCESSSCWDEVRCLGNKSVFIGMNNAYFLSIEDFPGLRANCICFTDTFEGMNCNIVKGRTNADIGFFDLEQEKFECRLPSSEKLLPPPIWFVPSIDSCDDDNMM
ncbi:putative F-box protein At5g55150 [Curcuma longa]|uniref:putative F-box protein At5g55150 n=1 Tax=Curcuma longa TaxID=136217 RepID=UPI003D9F0EC7